MRADDVPAKPSNKCTANFLNPSGPHDYLYYLLVSENFKLSRQRKSDCRHVYAPPSAALAPLVLFSPSPAAMPESGGPTGGALRLSDDPFFHVTLDGDLHTPKPAAVSFAPLPPPGIPRALPGAGAGAAANKSDPAATTCWNYVAAHLGVINSRTKKPYVCADGPSCARQHPAAGTLARMTKETFKRHIAQDWKFHHPRRFRGGV
jgi:hypothetical protein